jgi:hypothetical protein
MASSLITTLNFVGKEIVIYFAIPAFTIGVIGGFLNIIVFLSLRTFRQSSCAFYLTIMSVFDLGRFFSNVLAYIMRWGFDTNWGLSSLFFCKVRYAIFHSCTLISMTCLCLATIDQYFATCCRPHWQQWCNIKLAHRLTTIFIIIWTLYGIPYIIFYDHIISPLTNQTICDVTNDNFETFDTYGHFLILTNLIPLITVIFGLMAYHNARTLKYRIIPLVRRELDKQLTVMVLVQVLIDFCIYLPSSIDYMFSLINAQENDPVFIAKLSLADVIADNLLLLTFTVRIL